jgi:hypothetical protein
MSGLEVADPYVERLLEGVSFLAARVQLKLDAEFPRFTQALLEIVYPQYLAPTPSMLVARFEPDVNDPSLASGVSVPRHSRMLSAVGGDATTACEFRTAHAVTLWPIAIVSASYFSFAPDLPLNAVPVDEPIKSGIRVRLKAMGGLTFNQIALDRLCFYLTGHEDTANKVYELCMASGLGVLVVPGKGPSRRHAWLPASNIRSVGFTDDEALLPVTMRSFSGYRLVHEYFAFPQRYRFVEVQGLAGALARTDTDEIDLVIPFSRAEAHTSITSYRIGHGRSTSKSRRWSKYPGMVPGPPRPSPSCRCMPPTAATEQTSGPRISPSGASPASLRAPSSGRDHAAAISVRKCSWPWSILITPRSGPISDSSPCRRGAPTVTFRCRCYSMRACRSTSRHPSRPSGPSVARAGPPVLWPSARCHGGRSATCH